MKGPTLTLIQVSRNNIIHVIRDTWHIQSMSARCSFVLLFQQVKGTGYVFGAYIAVSWPKKPDQDRITVGDASGKSFLFSLTNQYNRPFRLFLKDKDRAIQRSFGGTILFGCTVKDASGRPIKFSNIFLMSDGKASNVDNANVSNDHSDAHGCAYQLDPWPANESAPPAFELNCHTFAGSQAFAAPQLKSIEVYSV